MVADSGSVDISFTTWYVCLCVCVCVSVICRVRHARSGKQERLGRSYVG